MSSGGSIPYNLRQNKAIERGLYIDLLARIGRYRNISDYTYVGFGGPFMEDFKLMHSELRISSMISIEADANVVKRQQFNMPLACISISEKRSGEFLLDHEFSGENIVWFDYAAPKDLPQQLAECESLIAKLNAGDVVKVTVNAHSSSLGEPETGDLLDYRAAVAMKRLGGYGPMIVEPDDVTANSYPKLLLKAIDSAMKRGVAGSKELYVQPLSAFVYKDGQQMLTATAIVLKHNQKQEFFEKSRLESWAYGCLDWTVPLSISIPDLSMKERLRIESLLPGATPQEIVESLGYFVGANEREASELMRNFVRYYRLSPSYSRVVM